MKLKSRFRRRRERHINGHGSTGAKASPTSPMRFFRSKRPRKSHSEPKTEQEALLNFQRSEIKVGRLLGEGGFAQVFSVKAKNGTLSKLALKQLRPELLQDKIAFRGAAKALVQEAHIMTLLRGHKNILTLRGVSIDADEPLPTKQGFDGFFLVTDALRETMTERVQRWNTQQPTQSRWMYQLQYALQVGRALAHCHKHSIVYRDCKVDNLGFSDEHTVQLFDFGMARSLPEGGDDFDDAQTCSSSLDELHLESESESVFHMTICGTQRHMAPEVYHGGWYNCKADVYGWAMTVVELITCRKPYPYMSLPVHRVLVLEGGGRPNLDGFPSGLLHILSRSWAQNLSERWSIAQVCAALETYIGSECNQQAVRGNKGTLLQDRSRVHNLDAVWEQCKESHPVFAGAA